MDCATEELPYNNKNYLITEADVRLILNTYDIPNKINNINVYRKAFLHKSYCTRKNENFVTGNVNCPADCLPLQEESNERYEFLGDAILNVTVAEYLYLRYPQENEGFLTRMRTKLVNGKMLAHLSSIVGLNKYIIISKQIEDSEGRNNLNILEDAFEAFIAAIFFDAGPERAKEWIINVIESNLDFSELVRMNNNYKDIMLKYFQQNHGYIPKFYEVSVNNDGRNKIFKLCLKDNKDSMISYGEGKTKKEAENDAAKKAITQYCPEYIA
jgi:ribonuclease-3